MWTGLWILFRCGFPAGVSASIVVSSLEETILGQKFVFDFVVYCHETIWTTRLYRSLQPAILLRLIMGQAHFKVSNVSVPQLGQSTWRVADLFSFGEIQSWVRFDRCKKNIGGFCLALVPCSGIALSFFLNLKSWCPACMFICWCPGLPPPIRSNASHFELSKWCQPLIRHWGYIRDCAAFRSSWNDSETTP